MTKYILIFFFSILLVSCGSNEEDVKGVEKNIKETSKVSDSISYYQAVKNKVVNLFEEDEQQEALIKKKQDLSKKYEEYNAVKNWFQTSNLEILEKNTLNFYKIVKAETTYKKNTNILYFTTPEKGIRYCYFNDDYIYLLEFNYDGSVVNYSSIERLSRGMRFEDFETLTFNNEGKIGSKVKKYNFRYTISKSEDGFHRLTYKNKMWEFIGNDKLVTTLTLDTQQYESSWKDSKTLDIILEVLLILGFIIIIIIILLMIFPK